MKAHNHPQDQFFMKRALELATQGRGFVSPNPLVGCVIVYDDKIIGEGWHQQYGQAHAEVNAVESVSDKSLLKDSTVYVTLEPCNHTGKTPPCAALLLKHQVKRVVIANIDTNPKVDGGGIKKLRDAGIEVVSGVLEHEGREMNKRFFHMIENQRPYIILKWAQTADGFIAKENYDSKWISNEHSRQLVHKWRSEEDAILVGTKTVFYDNPQLNVRAWKGRNPVRIVIDRFLKLDRHFHVFNRLQPTIVYNVLKHEALDSLSLIRLSEDNFLKELVEDLTLRKIQSVIVEGGRATLQQFINEQLWDETRIFIAEKNFEKGIRPPEFQGNLIASESVFNDTLKIYKPLNGKS